MISFYKPTPKVTGTAMSFYLNKRDNSFFASLIKQDSWDENRKVGSFQKNKKVEGKNVNIKFNPTEIASIIDSIDRNVEVSGYHGSNQVVRFSFGPYIPNIKTSDGKWTEGSAQKGFSFRVTRELKEDSTDKQSYVIGLNFPEARLLREHLLFLLQESFVLADKLMEKSFKEKFSQREEQGEATHESTEAETQTGAVAEEDELW